MVVRQDTVQELKEKVKVIAQIKQDIADQINAMPVEDRAAAILDNAETLEELDREYRIARSKYDVLYFTYEYFSDDRNPDNEDNPIPAGVGIEDAPHFHHELTAKIQELALVEPTKKICWSVPRGHAKSMYLSNITPLHAICFGLRKFIVIISETAAGARAFVEFISSQLKYNEKLRKDFGELLSKSKMLNDQDNLDGFVTTTGIKVLSSSIGKQLRGIKHGSERPDLIILDDLESRDNTNTKELRDKNLHWYNSVVVPLGTPEKTGILYMGTLVHGSGLLPDILNRADYDSKIYSAILTEPTRLDLWQKYEELLLDVENPDRLAEADGFYYEHQQEMDEEAETLWASRFPYKELIKKKVEIGSRAFSSEYLNRPSDPDSQVFNSDNIIFFDDKDLFDKYGKELKLDLYSFWDISIGKNSRADYNAIVTVGIHRATGVIYVLDAWAQKVPLHVAAEEAYQKIKEIRPKVFGVESIQAQYEIYRQLQQRILQEAIYGTRLKPVSPRGKKEDRIEILEPLVENGMLRFRRSQRLLLEQLEQFPNADHDDLPDALAQAVELCGNRQGRVYQRKPTGL